MSKLGGSGLLLAGVFLILFGLFIGSSFVEGLLDVLKVLIVILGIGLGVVGLIQMMSGGGKKGSSTDF